MWISLFRLSDQLNVCFPSLPYIWWVKETEVNVFQQRERINISLRCLALLKLDILARFLHHSNSKFQLIFSERFVVSGKCQYPRFLMLSDVVRWSKDLTQKVACNKAISSKAFWSGNEPGTESWPNICKWKWRCNIVGPVINGCFCALDKVLPFGDKLMEGELYF